MGTLVLDAGSILDYELNTPNVVGGATNDLVQVNGNLTLDGTLNVSTASASLLGGVYRVISYTGALTNQGLNLGALPAGGRSPCRPRSRVR